MTVQDEVQWQDRSQEELSAIVRRGVLGGDMFFAASHEMERRAKEAEAARDAERVVEVRTVKRIRWEVYALLALMAAGGLILLLR
jgi:hypothetical protein